MTQIDIPTLVNWIVVAAISFVFGVLGTIITLYGRRKQEEIAWGREKEKLEKEFAHEKELLEVQFKQRRKEIEEQALQQARLRLRDELLEGLDNPDRAITGLIEIGNKLRAERFHVAENTNSGWNTLHVLERVIHLLEMKTVKD